MENTEQAQTNEAPVPPAGTTSEESTGTQDTADASVKEFSQGILKRLDATLDELTTVQKKREGQRKLSEFLSVQSNFFSMFIQQGQDVELAWSNATAAVRKINDQAKSLGLDAVEHESLQ